MGDGRWAMGDGRSAIAKGVLRFAILTNFPIRDSQIPDSRFAIRAIHDSPFQLAISNQQLAIR